MSIEWTDEALEAAWNAMFETPFDGTQAPMIGAALDDAVKAQGIAEKSLWDTGTDPAYIAGRAEAFEEAAAMAEPLSPTIAALIRKLAKEPPK